MLSLLASGILLLAVIQVSTSASIPTELPETTGSTTTELPISTATTNPHELYNQSMLNHFRQVFLDFPCSDKEFVNHLFDVYEQLSSNENATHVENAMDELIRIAIIGNDSNISPEIWRPAKVFTKVVNEWPRERALDNVETNLHLTNGQSERLHHISSPKSIADFYSHLHGFPMAFALGIPESEIATILHGNKLNFEDVATDLGALAEQKCGRNANNTNILRDFTLARSFIKPPV